MKILAASTLLALAAFSSAASAQSDYDKQSCESAIKLQKEQCAGDSFGAPCAATTDDMYVACWYLNDQPSKSAAEKVMCNKTANHDLAESERQFTEDQENDMMQSRNNMMMGNGNRLAMGMMALAGTLNVESAQASKDQRDDQIRSDLSDCNSNADKD